MIKIKIADICSGPILKEVMGTKKAKVIIASPLPCLLIKKKNNKKKESDRFLSVKAYQNYLNLWMEKLVEILDLNGALIIWSSYLGKKPILEIAKNLELNFLGDYKWAKEEKMEPAEITAKITSTALILSKNLKKKAPYGQSYITGPKDEVDLRSLSLPLIKTYSKEDDLVVLAE